VGRVIAALPDIATTILMYAVVWRYLRQLKMPRLDAYAVVTETALRDKLALRNTLSPAQLWLR